MQTPILQGRSLRGFAWLAAIVLTLSYVFSALIYQPQSVLAAEVEDRSITLGSSEEDAETTYTVQFDLPAGTTAGGFRVEFCDVSPLPHTTCTFGAVGDDIPQVDSNAGTVVSLNGTSSATNATASECDTLTLAAPGVGDNHLDVTCTTADDFGGLASTVTLVFDDVDNPSNATDSPTNPNNTFYARIYVFSDSTPPAYTNPVATTEVVHTGGIAMSTAEQLTITARVQEILEFCVGTNATAPADCSTMSGNAVDLGVLDFGNINRSTQQTSPSQGSVMVRTNAATGVDIVYFAEQAATGTNHLGALRVAGASCNAGDVQTDPCIFSLGTTQTTITAGTEAFGMCIFNIDTTSSTGTATANVVADAEYDDIANGCDNTLGFAFDESGTTDQIATSVGNGGVVNDEMLELEFAATSAVTTPTGLYTVTLTFVGTATF